jgi:mono/diheme cytochrome c family protein
VSRIGAGTTVSGPVFPGALTLHLGQPMNDTPIVLALALTFSALGACSLAAQSPDAPAAQGRRLYSEHGCYGCHTVAGTGTPIAPDLSRAGHKYSEGEIARLLRDPALHKPGAHMPKLALTEAEARALAAYLATSTTSCHRPTPCSAILSAVAAPTARWSSRRARRPAAGAAVSRGSRPPG